MSSSLAIYEQLYLFDATRAKFIPEKNLRKSALIKWRELNFFKGPIGKRTDSVWAARPATFQLHPKKVCNIEKLTLIKLCDENVLSHYYVVHIDNGCIIVVTNNSRPLYSLLPDAPEQVVNRWVSWFASFCSDSKLKGLCFPQWLSL